MNYLTNYIGVIDGSLYGIYWRDGVIWQQKLGVLDEEAEALQRDVGRNFAACVLDGQVKIMDDAFCLVPVFNKHFLAFYHRQGQMGYREISGENTGEFKSFCVTRGQCVSHSFLATRYAIHGAFVLGGLFGSKLIYRRRTADGFLEKLVAERPRPIRNVVLALLNGRLYLHFMVGDILYETSVSLEGDGLDFSPALACKDFSGKNIMKAGFLYDHRNIVNFTICELLVEHPWDIRLYKKNVMDLTFESEPKAQDASVSLDINDKEDYHDFFNNIRFDL